VKEQPCSSLNRTMKGEKYEKALEVAKKGRGKEMGRGL
jgi:hypothetical protein